MTLLNMRDVTVRIIFELRIRWDAKCLDL
jgi:hypothetical protein